MRVKSLVAGYVLALALFLFAERRPSMIQPVQFRNVIDLTFPAGATAAGSGKTSLANESGRNQSAFRTVAQPSEETRLDAPATINSSLWTVEQIPARRLIAPLVVVDVRERVKIDPDYQLSVGDLSSWERQHGEIPIGSVVMALTGAGSTGSAAHRNAATHSPGYSADAAKFLVEGREVVGLGTDSERVDSGFKSDAPVREYSLLHSAYLLENVADLDQAPAGGGIIMVAPTKVENRRHASVRLLAMVR